ncbi:MAG: hypothetical protein JO131_09490 [Gammaproteobacteria bacterium]|nr:hypothetical protein [Gammaproteobacteria bacterium]
MLERKHEEIPIDPSIEISFKNWKIDYSRCIGRGTFGIVYEIVPRPEYEKGIFSYWCPYLYDYIFPVNQEQNYVPSPYCVKIFKSSFRLFLRDMQKDTSSAIHSFDQPQLETKLNRVLNQYGLSKIKFFKSNSIYAHFKTKLTGKTFYYYLKNDFFILKEQFHLRESFVNFLNLIKSSPLSFGDMHPDNIMYDEKEKRWEIVDGNVEISKPSSSNHRYFMNDLNINSGSKSSFFILKELIKCVDQDIPYTSTIDDELISQLGTQMEFKKNKMILFKQQSRKDNRICEQNIKITHHFKKGKSI